MQPRTFCFIAVFVGYTAFVFTALGTPIAVTNTAPTSEEQKVLLDCKNTDYRTYIKCLKRQKRHHIPHEDTYSEFESYLGKYKKETHLRKEKDLVEFKEKDSKMSIPSYHCWETCLKKCETERNCDKRCGHCARKTKHRHQIITEYEAECSSGECSNSSKEIKEYGGTNITTKIDIHNNIGNLTGGSTSTCCPTCKPPVPCPPNPRPWFPPLQLSLVPQLSFGLGLSLGGCPWPCPSGWPSPTHSPIDCSGCTIPNYRYTCDVSCYTVQPPSQPCISPYCVGGTNSLP